MEKLSEKFYWEGEELRNKSTVVAIIDKEFKLGNYGWESMEKMWEELYDIGFLKFPSGILSIETLVLGGFKERELL